MKSTKPIILLAFANDHVDNASYLRNLIYEKNRLQAALEPIEDTLCQVKILTNASIDNIFNTFQKIQNQVAIFHYGGHASGDMLMLENELGEHGFAHSVGLAPFLAKQQGLKMVFINGCSSKEQAEKMIDLGVPIVIGTSEEINDKLATMLSTRFYNGLATGRSIEQAWQEAIDYIKTKKGDTSGTRGLKLNRKHTEEIPWLMYVRKGSEGVKEWNLPAAAKNPLFGLPDLKKVDLPDKPFVFLRPYNAAYAPLFFGRGLDIRTLYNRITDDNGAPVILFYGQSGAGKSSLLDAGLAPRLNNGTTQLFEVVYKRRDATKGLLKTLDEVWGDQDFIPFHEQQTITVSPKYVALQNQIDLIKQLIKEADDATKAFLAKAKDSLEQQFIAFQKELEQSAEFLKQQKTRRNAWKKLEETATRPLLIILDQVEEVFTRGAAQEERNLDELTNLLLEIKGIFNNPQNRPKGKIVLSYRKEYHPEIEELSKKLEVPRESIFLKHLDFDSVVEIVSGLQSTPSLRAKYKLEVEENLPAIIADDLLEDKKAAIAPTLQILLSKMWDIEAKKSNRQFSKTTYQALKTQGLLMKDFYEQQIGILKKKQPKWIASGLVLDILNFHVTDAGTSGVQPVEAIVNRYHHITAIKKIVQSLKDLYLLAYRDGMTSLAHDTLAPVVAQAYNNSILTGQLATRILDNKRFDLDNENAFLDKNDLLRVEQGINGMRAWSDLEKAFVERSKVENEKREKELEEKNRALEAALQQAEYKAKEAEANRLSNIANVGLNVDKNFHKAMTVVKEAYKVLPTKTVIDTMYRSVYWNDGDDNIGYHKVKLITNAILIRPFNNGYGLVQLSKNQIHILDTNGEVLRSWDTFEPVDLQAIGIDDRMININIGVKWSLLFLAKSDNYFVLVQKDKLGVWSVEKGFLFHVTIDDKRAEFMYDFSEWGDYFLVSYRYGQHELYTLDGTLFKTIDPEPSKPKSLTPEFVKKWATERAEDLALLKEARINLVEFHFYENTSIYIFPLSQMLSASIKEDTAHRRYYNYKGELLVDKGSHTYFYGNNNMVSVLDEEHFVWQKGHERIPLEISDRNKKVDSFQVHPWSKYVAIIFDDPGAYNTAVIWNCDGEQIGDIYCKHDGLYFTEYDDFIIVNRNKIYTPMGHELLYADNGISEIISGEHRTYLANNEIYTLGGKKLAHLDSEIMKYQDIDLEVYQYKKVNDTTLLGIEEDTYDEFTNHLIIALRKLPILKNLEEVSDYNYSALDRKIWISNFDKYYIKAFRDKIDVVDIEGMKSYHTLPSDEILHCAYSPNDEYAFLAMEQRVMLFHFPTKQEIYFKNDEFSPSSQTKATFNPASTQVFIQQGSYAEEGDAYFWDFKNDMITPIPDANDVKATWHPDGSKLFLTTTDDATGIEAIFYTDTLKLVAHDDLRVSTNCTYWLVYDEEQEGEALYKADGTLVKLFKEEEFNFGLQFTNNEDIGLLYENQEFLIYNIKTEEITRFDTSEVVDKDQFDENQTATVIADELNFSPKGNYIYSCFEFKYDYEEDAFTTNETNQVWTTDGEPFLNIGQDSIMFSPDENYYLRFSWDTEQSELNATDELIVRLYTIDHELIADFQKDIGYKFLEEEVSFSHDENYILLNNIMYGVASKSIVELYKLTNLYERGEFTPNCQYVKVIASQESHCTYLVPTDKTLFEILDRNKLLKLSESKRKVYEL